MLLDIAKLRVLALAAGVDEIVASKGPGFGGPAAIVRVRTIKLAASKEVRLGRLYPKSKYDPAIGLLQLAVASRTDVGAIIAALTDLEVFAPQAGVIAGAGQPASR